MGPQLPSCRTTSTNLQATRVVCVVALEGTIGARAASSTWRSGAGHPSASAETGFRGTAAIT